MTSDDSTLGDAERNAAFERLMYRRSLKQVVAFMNKALEKSAPSEEPNGEKRPVLEKKNQRGLKVRHSSKFHKTPNTKKKTKQLIKETGDYSLADVRPTRIKKDRPDAAPQEKKGRANKYSELRRNATAQRHRGLGSARKSPRCN